MLTANIATAKNELSRLLRRVKQGESVIITERNRPIARLQPFHRLPDEEDSPHGQLEALYEAGVLTAPTQPDFDPKAFLAQPSLTGQRDAGLVATLLAEREEGR